MNDVTIRFLGVYEYLKEQKIVLNPKNFAKELSVSTSLITEICKIRTNAGITPIQNLVTRYKEIDANWLLTGEGSMLKNSDSNNTSDSNNSSTSITEKSIGMETNTNYKELAEARLEIIDLKNEKIEWLTTEIKKLRGL
jgi:hypothetical protein